MARPHRTNRCAGTKPLEGSVAAPLEGARPALAYSFLSPAPPGPWAPLAEAARTKACLDEIFVNNRGNRTADCLEDPDRDGDGTIDAKCRPIFESCNDARRFELVQGNQRKFWAGWRAEFGEFRRFGALTFPTRISQRGLAMEQVFSLTSYEFDTVPASAFELPAVIKALIKWRAARRGGPPRVS